MPVSGNEEAKVLARRSSDTSAGIPLKKRKFLLVPPPSPPRNEPPPALSEVFDVKNNRESSSDLKHKEEAGSDCKEKEESCSELKNKDEYGEDVEHKEATRSGVPDNVESTPDLKDKEESLSDQVPASVCVANKSPGISVAGKIDLLEVKKEIVSASSVDMDVSGSKLSEVRHLDELVSTKRGESKTELSLLTGKSAASEVLRTTGDADSVSVKKDMESKQIDDCNLKLSTVSGNDQTKLVPKEFLVSGFEYRNIQSNVNDSMHPSVLSLSLSKGGPTLEHKNGDASLSGDGKIARANRSNWDLNTTMDAWEGSMGEAALQGTVDGSTLKTNSKDGKLSSSSIPVTSVLSEKGKQVVSTNERRSSFPNSSTRLIQHSEDSLRLTLSSSFQEMELGRMLCGLSANLTYRNDVLNQQSRFESLINTKTSGFRVVKSEPTDENPKLNDAGASSSSTELLDFNSLKREPIDKHDTQVFKLTASSSHNLTAQQCIKSEPTSEVCDGMCGTPDLALQQSIGKFVHPQESGSSYSILTIPVTPPNPSPSRFRTSSELSLSADVSSQSEHSVHNKEFHFGTEVIVQPDMSPNPVNNGGRDENLAGSKIVNRATEAKNVDDSEMIKEHSHDLPMNGEGSVSDEEKINILAEIMEDESYGSDCESDGNQALGSHSGKQKRVLRGDDEYEDGEVREHPVHSKIGDPAASGIDAENAKLVFDNNDCPSGFPSDTDQCLLDVKDNELKIHDDMTMGCINENAGVISNKNYNQLSDKDGPSQTLPSDGMTANVTGEKVDGMTTVAGEKELCNSLQGKSGDSGGEKSSREGTDREMACDGASSGSRIVRATGEVKGEMVKAVNIAENPNLSSNGTNAVKDSTNGGNRSRIINLPRASVASPPKTRAIPDKLLSSRDGRERYSDLDGDKFFGTRDEIDTNGPPRFIRERIQDHPFRNSRVNYTRGRGRFSGRLDNSRDEWGSDRDFALGRYSDDYRFSRNKRAAIISDGEIDCDDYVVAPDGVGLSTGRGRKSLNDDLRTFRHHPSSRRFSSGVRDGPTGRGGEILRRIPRHISPSRRNDENGIGLVVQHDEKFVRVLPDDIIDPAYARPHSMYEGGDNPFIRGNRNFSTFQRRGFPRVRSKSPVRTRSPGPWSSPRRRSPDGFNALPHIAQHRSPAMYGMERMRSPDRSCFPEQIVARRRGSPSYMARPSNDSRDVDSGREHGHQQRPINPRRSPSDRVLNRSTRRLDDLDPRIRTNDDEYFGRPVHPGRFQDFHASSDERGKCSERRGLTRPFRPPYNMGDSDDGPRPMRFCSGAETEFTGRNTREREFDGQMKNRAMVAPRRIRSIDDQEGSYRHAGRVWHDDAFNEGSGFKRRRF